MSKKMGLYQEFVHKSRYARYLWDEGRRESWSETVNRYVDFWKEKSMLNDEESVEIANAIEGLEVMPSMRALMTAGPALNRDNMAGFNCSYVAVDHIRAFDEILYVLMCGTGVGFSVERQSVSKLPEVSERFEDTESVINVADSKKGWAKAFKELISLLYAGQAPQWDLSKIREKGAPLKVFGGRSSGPEPLDSLFKFTVGVFKGAVGRKLNSLECHDIVCKIAEVVVVGGVRRSALISLSNLSDDRMRGAKQGSWWETTGHRALANNSAVYTEQPDFEVFLKEMLSLHESKAGERGIFSRLASKKQAERNGRRDSGHSFGTNPCLHPDSLVQTVHGEMKIKDITEPTKVYSMGHDGKLCIRQATASWISKKDAKTINIYIASGKVVRCTPDHKIYVEKRGWIEAQDIHIGDRVVHLVRNRRGAAYAGVKLTSQDKRDYVMEHRMVFESEYGAIPDGYDIHHRDNDTYNNDIDNLECLSHEDHARLTALEQPNNHMVSGYHGKGGNGWGFISPANTKRGAKTVVPLPDELKSNLHQYATVVSISEGETTDVYDLTVEDTHNFIADFVVVHNCSEIILRSAQVCNLSEVVVRNTDTLENLKRKVRLATILGTLQSTLTNFDYVRAVWKRNTEEERLLGVSLTGIMDHPVLSKPIEYGDFNWFGQTDIDFEGYPCISLDDVLEELKQVAVETNKEWSAKLGVEQSTAITCVKPSGTVSQLVDSASGIHARFSDYYIRRVRNDMKDPVTDFLKESGVPWEQDVTNPETVVFSFPMKAPDGAVTVDDQTALSQLELWEVYQDSFCEHKPSITVYYSDDEFLSIGQWLWDKLDKCSGVSLLPRSDHIYQQAPYEAIDKDTYEKLCKVMPETLDWSLLDGREEEDNTVGAQTLACTGSSCEL
jgi:ribonucleotide reductase alpha subunit